MKGHDFRPKSSSEYGRGNPSAGLQNASSFNRTAKAHGDQKLSAAAVRTKPNSPSLFKSCRKDDLSSTGWDIL